VSREHSPEASHPAILPAMDTAAHPLAPGASDDGRGGAPALGRSLECVARAREGDRDALDELFRRYEERVRRIARIRMGPRVRAVMESADLVQDTFVVAQRRIHDFEPRSHAAIVHWLARILQHQINDARDRATAARRDLDRERPLQADVSAPGDPPASDPSPSEIAAAREQHEIYDACVRELEGDEREVILLRDYAGGTWEFVSAELGRPSADAALQLYCRARVKLARIVGQRLGATGG
jgi:RNA polymerase sigma-70 factor (ECF subfamily)